MSQVTLKGSCLCGAVAFEIEGDARHFYHCHCSRCRKSTGTGHATNLMLMGAKLAFTSGESLLRSFKPPQAQRFTRQFCGNCGSPVPRYVPEMGFALVPAGSVDSEIPLTPQARIYWDSRAAWSCGDEPLPRFAEGPQSERR